MSKVPAQIRAYVRPSRRHGQREQTAALVAAGISPALTYTEGKHETLGDCLKSLLPGDTLAVMTLARLHNRRDGLLAVVRELAAKHVTLWIVGRDEKYSPADLAKGIDLSIEALDELANDKRRMTRAEARRAAEIRHSRTPTNVARAIWENTKDYPTTGEALAHPDMDGWDLNTAYKKLKARGTAVRAKATT